MENAVKPATSSGDPSFSDRISEIARHISGELKGSNLTDWAQILEKSIMPDQIQTLIERKCRFRFLNNPEFFEEGNPHQPILDKMCVEDDRPAIFASGTLDAKNDPVFRDIFDRLGWRTVIYFCIRLSESAIPEGTGVFNKSLKFSVPAVLYSESAAAIDPDDFALVQALVLSGCLVMLLRFGFTWSGTQVQKLWDALPGACGIVSSEHIFLINNEFKELYHLDAKDGGYYRIGEVFPRDISDWIKNNIENGDGSDSPQLSRIFRVEKKDRNPIYLEIMLRPYKQFEYLVLHKAMVFGYKDLSTDQLDSRLHLMIIRDVTLRWETEKLQQEIFLARKVQIGLLPSSLPRTKGLAMAVDCVPAGHIGGDFYDVVTLPGGRLAIFLGDATGHGIDSALLSAMASGAFRASVIKDARPSSVLTSIDRVLRAKRQPGFVTAAYLLISKPRDRIFVGLAGHHAPFLIRSDSRSLLQINPSSLPLGVNLKPSYYFSEFALHPKDVVAVVSDGLLEMRNEVQATYDELLPQILIENLESAPEQILKTIFNEAAHFIGGRFIEDDLTAVVMKVA